MRARLSLLAACFSLALSACGTPQGGDTCDKNGFLCQDGQTALECKVGVWTILPCRGPSGCTKVGENIACDMTANQAGDNCASTTEGKGICAPGGTATLECRQGKLVQTNTCNSCSVSGEQIICTQ